jgi:integrase
LICTALGVDPLSRLPAAISNHTFRATGITAYLENGGTLEKAQQIAAHESARTTKLYDRTNAELGRDVKGRLVARVFRLSKPLAFLSSSH